MESKEFWPSVEAKAGPVDRFFKTLLDQRNYSSFSYFLRLSEEDITNLCVEMQEYLTSLEEDNECFKELLQHVTSLNKDYELSLAFKSTCRSIAKVVTKIYDEMNEAPRKKKRFVKRKKRNKESDDSDTSNDDLPPHEKHAPKGRKMKILKNMR